MQIFDTKIVRDESGRLTYIELPFDAKNVFNKPKGTIFVTGTINDIPYRSKLLSRGNGKQIMSFDKSLQKAIGFCGETMPVHITMLPEDVDMQNNTDVKPIVDTCNIDVLTAIRTRHSIRKYTSEPIVDGLLNTILHAGLYAPTAKNKRPYHFIVIKNRDTLSELSCNNPNASMLVHAACGIVICGDRNIEGMKEFLYADCAAAAQNILLCIHSLGLGGVWCGVAANSEWYKLIIEKLNLPLKVQPIAVIALGNPDENKVSNGKWESEKIHYDIW